MAIKESLINNWKGFGFPQMQDEWLMVSVKKYRGGSGAVLYLTEIFFTFFVIQ